MEESRETTDRSEVTAHIQQDHLWPWDRHNHHQDSNKHLNLLY